MRVFFRTLQLAVLPALLVFGALPLRAAVRSARWEIAPAPPLYEGQTYEIRLLVETDPDEEITNLRLSAGPERAPDAFDTRREADCRTTLCTWEAVAAPGARSVALPPADLLAELTVVRRHGFASFSQSVAARASVPALEVPVDPLPGDAAGLPIGDFVLALSADSTRPAPGDVIRLRATVTARGGALPAELPLALASEPAPAGRVWPFRILSATSRRIEAEAYYALPDRPLIESLALAPLRVFDLRTRAPAVISCPPLVLAAVPASPSETPGSGAGETPLRYAPSGTAPALGILTDGRIPLETHGAWTRLPGGWVPTAALGTPGTAPSAPASGGTDLPPPRGTGAPPSREAASADASSPE